MSPSETRRRLPLILDVDTGIDDAFALLLAMAEPSIDLLGVATVAGNVNLKLATRNTRAVLALGGRADLPVWPGCAAPLRGSPADASEVHGHSGVGYAELPEPPPQTDPPDHAVDRILAASHAHAGELALVATGPLTNIAVALLRDPTLARRLKRLVLMGGAFRDVGNVTPSAEFNIWYDPEAAATVFSAFAAEGAAPLLAVGLDVTRRTVLTPAHFDALAARCAALPRGPAIAAFMADSARFYFDRMTSLGRARQLTMHDPLALGAAVDPTLLTTTRARVDVETTGEFTRGMTVTDWSGQTGRPNNADIATEVDAQRFIAGYIAAIERLAAR